MKLYSLCGLKPPLAPGPRGNQSRRFPPSEKQWVPPPLRGLQGGIHPAQYEMSHELLPSPPNVLLLLDRKAEFDMQKIFRIVPVNNIRYHII